MFELSEYRTFFINQFENIIMNCYKASNFFVTAVWLLHQFTKKMEDEKKKQNRF